jgi:hypothetical protein
MTQRTLLPACEEAVSVPRTTEAKEAEGLVMVLMSGKQVVVVVATAGSLTWPYLTQKRTCAQ